MIASVQPLVSVAIITYNQEQFIEDCVRSVIDQDYRPLQIVVADDGSTDRTPTLVARIAAEHPGLVTLVRARAQGGITENQNRALAACKGQFVAWLGGDDILLPTKISRQIAVMTADPSCVICYHDMDVFESDTNRSIYRFSERNRPREGGMRVVARRGCFNCGSATMVRRSACPDRFDSRVLAASDWLHWLQTLQNGGRIRYIDDVLGRYRRHSGNVTGSLSRFRSLTLDHLVSAMIAFVGRPALVADLAFTVARNIVSLGRRSTGVERALCIMLGAGLAGTAMILRPFSFLDRDESGSVTRFNREA